VGYAAARQQPLLAGQLELGDALWCVAITADTLGISLEAVARRNVDKLRVRYPP